MVKLNQTNQSNSSNLIPGESIWHNEPDIEKPLEHHIEVK